jgi:hypothetical protein
MRRSVGFERRMGIFFCFCRFLGEFEVHLLRHRFYMQP